MNATRPSAGSLAWMRVVVLAAAVHGFYNAFHAGSIEAATLRASISIGLAVAAIHPLRYWPMVLTGLTSHLLPPVFYALTGEPRAATATISNAIWWVPLSLVLVSRYFLWLEQLRLRVPKVLGLALRARTDRGFTIEQISCAVPVLLVFLRHAGCTFCREALADLAAQRSEIERSGASIVIVHMGEAQCGRDLFGKYGLTDLQQISDPARRLYKAFGLNRGDLRMLFGPKVWLRGFDAAILRRHGAGRLAGDGMQMPGLFLVFHGQVLRSFRHQSAADRPDYVRFVTEDSFSRMVS